MNKALVILAILFTFCFVSVTAQEELGDKRNLAVQRIIELIAEANEDEEIDYTTLLDVLNDRYDRPLDLNTATAEELRSTYLLTDFQILDLQRHILRYGKLLSIFELQAVEGMDMQTIQDMRPFVTVGRDIDALSISRKEIWDNGKNELFLRWTRVANEQKGYLPLTDADFEINENGDRVRKNENSRFLGSPDRYYLRYRFRYSNKISAGLTAEKDAGEEFFQGSQKRGFDYYSAHLLLRDFGKLKRLALGDFQAQFGQGLTLWSGLAFGKSPNILSVKRNPQGIRQYTSVDENAFLRGAAATYELGPLDVTLMGSRKNRDANILDTLDNELIVSSLQASGIHSTPAELADRKAIEETVIGANVNYTHKYFNVGVTGARTSIDSKLTRNLQPYQTFEFNSDENLVLGVDYNATVRNINFFGEVARSQNGGTAYVNGALVAVDPKVTMSVLHRHYDRDYQSQWATAIGESTRNANEQGLLLGLEIRPAQDWIISGYFDRFKFPWLRFQVDGPSQGKEGILQVEWRPSRDMSIYARYRHRERPRNSTLDNPIDQVSQTFQNNYRLQADFKVSESVRLRNRVEWTDFTREGNGTSRGLMVYQDVRYKPLSSPVSFTLRYALFDTDNYDARIYAYETDLLYFYSVPALSGVGTRFYTVARWRVSRDIDVWAKYVHTSFGDEIESLGSGLNEIQGNSRTDVRLQVRFKF